MILCSLFCIAIASLLLFSDLGFSVGFCGYSVSGWIVGSTDGPFGERDY
jgi:hypothetical protein